MDDLLLSAATMQDIQLEILRRSEHNALNGAQVAATLLGHRELWRAAILDRLDGPSTLIKLRDLHDNFWNADTVYILTESESDARRLIAIIEAAEWDQDDVQIATDDEASRLLGRFPASEAIVSVWWD